MFWQHILGVMSEPYTTVYLSPVVGALLAMQVGLQSE